VCGRRGEGAILAFGAAVVVASEFVVVGIAPSMARDLGLSLAQVGWFVTWFAIGSAVLGPAAVLAARRMRSDLAMIAALAPFVASLLMHLVADFWLISLLRLLQGAALPLFMSVASDALGRLWGRDQKAVARIYVGVVTGSVLALPVGAAIADHTDWRITFAALGWLAALAILLIMTQPSLRVRAVVVGGLRREAAVFLRPAAMLHLLLSLVQFAAMFCTYAFLAGILEHIGISKGNVGAWLLVFGIAGIAGNAAAGRVPMAWLRASALTTAAMLGAAAMALPFLTTEPILLAPVLVGWGAAHAAAFVIAQLRVTRDAYQAPRLAAAMNISAANIGIAAGSVAGGQALAAAGVPGLAAAGLALSAVTLILAMSVRYGPGPLRRERAFRSS
jgi:predicted MFS family arabinose efflux permease